MKKKVIFHSDFALSKTGFGRNSKAILSYLYGTGKYELVSVSGGVSEKHPELERTPWKSLGVVPVSGPEKADYDSSPDKKRMYAYGAYALDKIVQEEKPDAYIGVQDYWGLEYSIEKPWFKTISSALWITLDSLPLLEKAVKNAPKIKNYWVWSEFAEKEMHRLGHKHVKTLHGSVEDSYFFPLEKNQRNLLRERNSIKEDDFVIGFVFRNQLRKSVPNLLNGFRIFKEKNPNVSAKLLLHTSWKEGWNIQRLCKEKDVDIKDVLTTYVCKSCGSYKVDNFKGPELECPFCGTKGSFSTTGTTVGVTEGKLNEVYNLMDVYCHPFTSGGQEIPIQEAKLAGLVTLVTSYSCGEDMCVKEAHSLPLDWDEYSEFGTEFIKASTRPESIAENLRKVYETSPKERRKSGKLAREWVLQNFSVEVVGKKIEAFLDNAPKANYDLIQDGTSKINPEAEIPEQNETVLWLKSLYKNILGREVYNTDEGLIHWVQKINAGMTRQTILGYFRSIARQELNQKTPIDKKETFKSEEKEEKILVKIDSTEDNIYLATKIVKGIKNKYPDKKIIVFTNKSAEPILVGNSDIDQAFVQGLEFSDPEFIKNNFYECYSLDDFCLNNNHSVYLK